MLKLSAKRMFKGSHGYPSASCNASLASNQSISICSNSAFKSDCSTNIAFNSECMGYAHAADITSKVYENEDTDEVVAMAKTYGGATSIDSDGLHVIYTYEPDLTESAT